LSENRKNPTRMAPEIPTPATTMNGSPHRGVTLASSSLLRRPRAAASSSMPATKAKTAVAVASIGHHSPVTDRAAGPFGLTIEVSPPQAPTISAAATAGSVRAPAAIGPRPLGNRPVGTPGNFPSRSRSKRAPAGYRGNRGNDDRRDTARPVTGRRRGGPHGRSE